MTGDEPEGFLDRWSRVKRTAARSVPELEPEPEPDPVPETSGEADPGSAEEDAPALDFASATLSEEELAALPRVEELMQGSDIRPFLRAGVPRGLRNAAMRRIWMLTPGIRDYQDPAVDYAWDWNTPGGVPGDGLAPTPERAAQMLKSLLDRRPEATLADSTGEGGDAPPDPAGSGAPETTDMTPDDSQDLVEDIDGQLRAEEQAATVAESQEGPEADADPAPRRRHGSALPG